MRCEACHRQLRPRAESPGYFSALTLLLVGAAIALVVLASPLWALFPLVGASIAGIGVVNSIIDGSNIEASCGPRGVECRDCGHLNLLRPWTF